MTAMKTLLMIVLLSAFSTTIIAQNSFGVRIAYNNTNATASQYSKTAGLSRFQSGIFAKCYVHHNWYVKGNILYNQKGNFYDDIYMFADAGKKVNIELNYAEVSIDAGYSIKVKAQQNIHIGVGPYLAYGINGTEKGWGESLMGPIKIDRKIDFVKGEPKYGTNTQIKQADAGLNFNIEYQYKNYGLFINYGLGLTDREGFYDSFNRVASVGLSYSFSFKKQGKGCFTE
jgi:uncharacterized protein YdeI (BOF family)